MRVTKCDLCKKQIKGEPVTAGRGFFPKTELCEKCGAPILRFLEKHKFIKSEKIKNK
jgi:uncharacterized OB-fold protein